MLRIMLNAERMESFIREQGFSLADEGRFMRRVRAACHAGDLAFLGALSWVRVREPRIGRSGMTAELRRYVLDRDGRQCVLCESTDRLQVDHIVPVVRGGSDDESNLQTLCTPCNRAKGPLPWERRRMVANG